MAVSDAQVEALIQQLEKLAAGMEGSSGSRRSSTESRASSAARGDGDDDLSYWNRVRKNAKIAREEMKQAIADIEEEQNLVGISIEQQRELQELKTRMAGEDKIARARNRHELKAALKLREDNNQAIKDGNELLRKQAKEMEAGAGKAEYLANSFLSIGGAAEEVARTVPLSAKEMRGFATATVESIASGQFFFNIARKLIGESFNLAYATDESAAAFRRMTGAADEEGLGSYGKILSNTRDQVAIFGAGHKEAAAAMGALYDGYSDFTTLNDDQKEAILAQTVALDALGVSSQTSGQIFDRATKSLGFNENQLEGLTETLHATAQSLGKSTKAVFEDFNAVSKQLAFYGKDVVTVFQDLQKQSKATGLSVTELVNISGKAFDTFDGAAKKVGKLNAILGGPYLNSIDMLNASEAERIDMLKQSMDMAGQTYSELNKFEQLAIADALGVDVDTARRMFGELSAAEELEIRNQEKIAETAREAQKTMDKLRNAFMSLVVAMDPVIGFFSTIVGGLSDFINMVGQFTIEIGGNEWEVGKWVKRFWTFGGALAALTLGLLSAYTIGSKVMGVLGGLGSALPSLPGAPGAPGGGPPVPEPPAPDATSKWDSFTEGIKKLGEAVKGTWKEMLAFGAAILMIGGGIGLAAVGLSHLVEAFQDLTGGQIVGAVLGLAVVMGGFVAIMYAMVPAITAIGAASYSVAPGILAVGAAFLMLGVGIGLAAVGLSILVESFKGLSGEELIAASIGVIAFSVSVWALIAAAAGATATAPVLLSLAAILLAMGVAAIMMATGINIAAAGMAVFMEAIMMVPPEKMVQLAMGVAALSASLLLLGASLVIAAVGFTAIATTLVFAMPIIAASTFVLFGWGAALTLVSVALFLGAKAVDLFAASMRQVSPAVVAELAAALTVVALQAVKAGAGLVVLSAGFAAFALASLMSGPSIVAMIVPLYALGGALAIVGNSMEQMSSSMRVLSEIAPELLLVGAAFGEMAGGLAKFSAALLLLNVKKLEALTEFNKSVYTPEPVPAGTFAPPGAPGAAGTAGQPGAPGAAGGAAGTTPQAAATTAMQQQAAAPVIKIYLGDAPIENIVEKVIEELPISPYRPH
tara:strand:- start:6865 stop:10164 length:3300 start_codon:yes stop_codon:yes gene_type:complete